MNLKPPLTFSIAAVGDIRASRPGSSRTIPLAGVAAGGADDACSGALPHETSPATVRRETAVRIFRTLIAHWAAAGARRPGHQKYYQYLYNRSSIFDKLSD